MNLRLFIIIILLLYVQPIAAQLDAPLGEPSDSASPPSPIQSESFPLLDPRNYKDDTLGDERITDDN